MPQYIGSQINSRIDLTHENGMISPQSDEMFWVDKASDLTE